MLATSGAVQVSVRVFRAEVDNIRPHLVQRALVMGACSQEAEGWAEKIFHPRRSCQHTPQLLVHRALVLGAGRQEAEGRVGKARSLDSVIRITNVIHAQSNSCETVP